MKIDNFIDELKKLNIVLNEIQLNQLEKYYELLVEYNKVMNLTGITEKEEVYSILFAIKNKTAKPYK